MVNILIRSGAGVDVPRNVSNVVFFLTICIHSKPRGGETGSNGQLTRITCTIKMYVNRFHHCTPRVLAIDTKHIPIATVIHLCRHLQYWR